MLLKHANGFGFNLYIRSYTMRIRRGILYVSMWTCVQLANVSTPVDPPSPRGHPADTPAAGGTRHSSRGRRPDATSNGTFRPRLEQSPT
ncbi:unnamed protein product [Plutella xylostella]|uniref:(diamondback moth) hypothetical protein n=1 Tax=Plutella xylostella TaxID=51655 RepID=A0A8S4CZH1_PLUXY|nr:unnamed protein product [Plutella xylostella]